MAGSVNRVILVGNVGKDPEIITTNGGTKIAKFSIATSENWRDKETGERKESTEWHNIVVFNDRLVEVVEKYVVKGKKVFVCGAQKTRSWDDKDSGKKRYATETVLANFAGELQLLSPSESRGAPSEDDYGTRSSRESSGESSSSGSGGRPARRSGFTSDPNDDIPF